MKSQIANKAETQLVTKKSSIKKQNASLKNLGVFFRDFFFFVFLMCTDIRNISMETFETEKCGVVLSNTRKH